MAAEVAKGAVASGRIVSNHALQIETRSRVEFKDMTALIEAAIRGSGIEEGLCHVFTPHTTAAILINENDDWSLQKDFDDYLGRLAPRDGEYHHNDGNCDAHLKAATLGCSKTLMIDKGKLVLGRWQGVFYCEFDGPRRREVRLKIVSD
ncbi:MAG: secondary thiamine-phosphate synthase enzyme YjbQ [Terriglobia bacterium]